MTNLIEKEGKKNVILKDKTQLETAIAKALKIRPRVQFVNFGRYQVFGEKFALFISL